MSLADDINIYVNAKAAWESINKLTIALHGQTESFRKFNDALRAIDGRPPAHYNPDPMFGLRTRVQWLKEKTIRMSLTEWPG